MYSYRKNDEDGSVELVNEEGDAFGTVLSEGDAETLLGYLNAGEGGFKAVPDGTEDGHNWVFVTDDDTWVAYTDSYESAETILSHLNRYG